MITIKENIHVPNAEDGKGENVGKYQSQGTQITFQNHENIDQTPLLAPHFDDVDPTSLDLSLSKRDPTSQSNHKGVSSANRDQRSANLWAAESLKSASGVQRVTLNRRIVPKSAGISRVQNL